MGRVKLNVTERESEASLDLYGYCGLWTARKGDEESHLGRKFENIIFVYERVSFQPLVFYLAQQCLY